MKKCASCTKDLPDAALHCVFCGAKQPPAPAVQPAMAKTAFGYSAAELQEQARQQGAPPARPPQAGQPAPGFPPPPAFAPARPAAPPSSNQAMGLQQTMLPPEPPSSLQPQPQRSASPLAMAATQAVQAYPGPGPSFGGPNQGPSVGGPAPFGPGPGPAFGQGPGPGPGPAFGSGPSPAQGPTYGPGPAFGPGPAYGQGPGPAPGYAPAASGPTVIQGQPPQPQPGFVPASAASAKTMFVPGQPGPAPQGSFGPGAPAAMQPTIIPAPLQPMPMAPRPMQAPPMSPQIQAQAQPMPQPMAIPAAQPPPYHASQSLMQHRRPIDPWRDSLRAMLFIWGVLLLAAFATPLTTKPSLTFLWNTILDGEGKARLPPMVIAAVGLLSVIIAVIPMPTAPRGVIATLLGLAGILVPILIVGVPPWQVLLVLVGTLLMIPGLIIRSEYVGSMLPRVMVTLGALAMLLPLLLPEGGAIPLISHFKQVIDLPGSAKVIPALELGEVVIVILALLFAWMPAPVNGGAKLWAWLIILWSLVLHLTGVLLAGHLGDAIVSSPHAALVPWIYGGLGAAYLVIIGYGLASALGKQLE